MPTPLLLLGDSPRRQTGLARIARDLATRLQSDPTLDLQVVQAGPDSGRGESWRGWGFFGLPEDDQQWGATALAETWQTAFGTEPGVVLTVWDPARCFHLLQARHLLPPETQWWGYFPIDAWTVRESFGGPAAQAVQTYDRVLGYGRWGAGVLKRVTGRPTPYLPHGLDLGTFAPGTTPEVYAEVRQILGRRVTDQTLVLGCVAANQPRKDLGSYCATLRTLLDRGAPVHGWLHTDLPIGVRETQWVVPQLVDEYDLRKHFTVTSALTDVGLAGFYAVCAATLACGLGEGFGYPIVESLACGTPAIHSTYGGGAELVPRSEWRIPVRAERVEGPYALVRPVYLAEDFANAFERVVDWRRQNALFAGAYCRGAVAHLDWAALWPRWASWIRTGLKEL